jgi:hypothetical protein
LCSGDDFTHDSIFFCGALKANHFFHSVISLVLLYAPLSIDCKRKIRYHIFS